VYYHSILSKDWNIPIIIVFQTLIKDIGKVLKESVFTASLNSQGTRSSGSHFPLLSPVFAKYLFILGGPS
jgi:hypothetical protein